MNRHAKASSVGSTQRRSAGFGAIACAAAVALLALCAASASATIAREPEPFSPLDGSGSELSLSDPSGVAVDEANGNVFVTSGYFGEEGGGLNGAAILADEGGMPSGLIAPFSIESLHFSANSPAFLAYDNSASSAAGTVYAYDRTVEQIKRFTHNAATESYEEEEGGAISVPGCGVGVGGGMDAEGNVYFGCSDLRRVYEFSPTGTKLHDYSLSDTPITGPGSIAVDNAGDLFVAQQYGKGHVYKLPINGSGEIEPSKYEQVGTAPGSGYGGVAYEPEADEILVSEEVGGKEPLTQVGEYDATTLAKLGQFGREQFIREYEGDFYPERIERFAIDLTSHRVYVAEFVEDDVVVFGPDVIVPTTKVSGATNITGTKATLNGSVNPEGIEVTECAFEWGETTAYGKVTPCASVPPTDSETHAVSADISGLTSNGVTYHYRLVAKNENGTEKSADKTLVTGGTVITEAATGVGTTTAALHGTVRPEGLEFSECAFEYKLTTAAAFQEVPCSPPAAEIEPDFEEHAVSASLTKLQPNASYEFRLTATNSKGPVSGEVRGFTMVGPPQIGEVRALSATQSSVLLEGKINPSGFGTSYRFEWGPSGSYGHQVPAEFEPFIGSGTDPVRVSVNVGGLSAASTYHYRIVATSPAGVTESPDQTLETLNSCGLAENRCFELISRSDAGPVANPGILTAPGAEFDFQAANGSGTLAYPVESGYPDATNGAVVVYRATRGPGSWDSTQLNAPLFAQNEQGGTGSATGKLLWLSGDLSCGFFESSQPLTDDLGTRLAIESGGRNLYRLNPDGSYTAVTTLAPTNALEVGGQVTFYKPATASQDCSKVVFTSKYRYPGVPAEGVSLLGPVYEWDEGTLRGVGFVPGPSGEVVAGAILGATTANPVSEDGSRVFFTATRQASPNAEEINKQGVFAREDGTHTIDVSLSETSTPDAGATYRFATPDGSRVFFTANAGLTEEASSEGQDLYEYDFEAPEGERLTDLSVDHEAGGAQAASVAAVSEDGSAVYFAARGQLLPGRGDTFAQNVSAGTYSLYGLSEGVLGFAGTITNEDLGYANTVNSSFTSQASPDGRYLLFESRAKVTGYESGGAPEAYLYDSEAASEATVCVSCRPDGKPSAMPAKGLLGRVLLASASNLTAPNPSTQPRSLVVRKANPEVLFFSPDPLGSGSVEGQSSIFQWSHGQIFRLTEETGGAKPIFAGASEDGTDAYVATAQTLSWEDGDTRPSVYDARVGGGFPEPAPPAEEPCDPSVEGSCEGQAAGAPSVPGAASATFSGPGNPPAKESVKKKHKKKHKSKKRRHAKKQHKRHAKHNRRAGK